MVSRYPKTDLTELYEADETAWLESMAELIRSGRVSELDLTHLAEYLDDMARRDKREVLNRLAVLIAHLLKWDYQSDKRSSSWRVTVEQQQQELAHLLESGVLRQHAEDILAKAYANGVRQAVADTGLPESTFPGACPYSVESLLEAKPSGA